MLTICADDHAVLIDIEDHGENRSEEVGDGPMLVNVNSTWLRPPQWPIDSSILFTAGLTPCICSIRAQHVDVSSNSALVPRSSRDELLEGVHEKHFAQRYRYFTRYDEGIVLDFEGLSPPRFIL